MGKQDAPRANRNFHEAYTSGAVKPPSARSTGFVFAGIAVLLAISLRHHEAAALVALGAAIVFLALSLLAPRILEPLNIVWFKLGMVLHKVVNPVVMLLMYGIAFVPLGLLMRHSTLRLRREPQAPTYWLAPDPAETELSSMSNQF
jgi:hypothetical protein